MGFWDRFKAWRRGERKVKGVTRGRCYEKKNADKQQGGAHRAKAKCEAKLTGIKVIRKDGTEEVIR